MVHCLRYSTDEKKNGWQNTCGSADKKIIGCNAWLYECENKHEKIKFTINLHAVCAQMARWDIFYGLKKVSRKMTQQRSDEKNVRLKRFMIKVSLLSKVTFFSMTMARYACDTKGISICCTRRNRIMTKCTKKSHSVHLHLHIYTMTLHNQRTSVITHTIRHRVVYEKQIHKNLISKSSV